MKRLLFLFLSALMLASCQPPLKTTDAKAVPESIPDSLSFLAEKWYKSTDFYAIGTEPFWSMDIDREKEILFTTSDGQKLVFTSAQILWSGAGEFSFTAKSETAAFECTVTEENCSDNMSEDVYFFKVEIGIRMLASGAIENYSGCGNTVPDFALEGKWKLVELASVKATETDFYGKIPVFSFTQDERRFGGSSGCNMISGNMDARNGKIVLGPLMSTKMACREGKEEALNQAFDKVRYYAFEGSNLVLKDEKQKNLLVFQKAE
ncbi:MAG: META domain-containing protein [Bacteroidales bacterium]